MLAIRLERSCHHYPSSTAFLIGPEQDLREDGPDSRAGTRPIGRESKVVPGACQEAEGQQID